MNVIAQSETTVQKASRSSSFSWLYDISKWVSLGLLNIGKKKLFNKPTCCKEGCFVPLHSLLTPNHEGGESQYHQESYASDSQLTVNAPTRIPKTRFPCISNPWTIVYISYFTALFELVFVIQQELNDTSTSWIHDCFLTLEHIHLTSTQNIPRNPEVFSFSCSVTKHPVPHT